MKHVAVIGAGIIGAASAYSLARAGHRVTVIDRGLPGGVASSASFGWVNASFFLNEAHFHLRHAAMAAHRALEADLPGFHDWSGCLWFEAQGEEAMRFAAQLQALGYRVEDLQTPDLRARFPRLVGVDHAIFLPEEGAIDTPALARALLVAARAEVWSGLEVNDIRVAEGCVTGVQTAAGPLAVDEVVLAAGVGAPELLSPLGLTLPLLRRPGLMVRTRPVARIATALMSGEMGEIRQLPDGSVLIPTSVGHQGDASQEPTATPGDLARQTLDRLQQALPGMMFETDTVLMANRPVPGDGLPVLSRALPGLTVAVMHSGATLAPLAGQAVADIISETPVNPLWQPYDLGRFAK